MLTLLPRPSAEGIKSCDEITYRAILCPPFLFSVCMVSVIMIIIWQPSNSVRAPTHQVLPYANGFETIGLTYNPCRGSHSRRPSPLSTHPLTSHVICSLGASGATTQSCCISSSLVTTVLSSSNDSPRWIRWQEGIPSSNSCRVDFCSTTAMS